MDEGPRTDAADSVVLTGLGHVLGAPCDPRPFLRVRKNRKFMGLQDDLAVVAAGRALESAGLADAALGERAGLYLAVGYIPFERADIDSLMEGSLSDGRLSMKLFSTTGYNAINPLLTFRCLSNMPAFHISVNFDLQGPYFVTYPGIGQFYQALELARAALASGEVNIALVGAVAAQRNFLVEHHHARLSPPVAADTLADVAGCLVMETESHTRKRDGTVRGRLEKYELAYNPFDPFKQPPEFYEQFDNGEHPPGELGPASLAVALGLNPSTTLRHEAQTRDGFRVASEWELA
jgi:3-oxoacyl-(acyl-carrier-protein) synthase